MTDNSGLLPLYYVREKAARPTGRWCGGRAPPPGLGGRDARPPSFETSACYCPVCFGMGFPASRLSASFTARLAAMIALLVVDSGPSESVLAKNTRSIGSRTKGCTLVYRPGVDI